MFGTTQRIPVGWVKIALCAGVVTGGMPSVAPCGKLIDFLPCKVLCTKINCRCKELFEICQTCKKFKKLKFSCFDQKDQMWCWPTASKLGLTVAGGAAGTTAGGIAGAGALGGVGIAGGGAIGGGVGAVGGAVIGGVAGTAVSPGPGTAAGAGIGAAVGTAVGAGVGATAGGTAGGTVGGLAGAGAGGTTATILAAKNIEAAAKTIEDIARGLCKLGKHQPPKNMLDSFCVMLETAKAENEAFKKQLAEEAAKRQAEANAAAQAAQKEKQAPAQNPPKK